MWNHGPEMWNELGGDVNRVSFQGDEMADLIAYLYFIGFLNVSGSEGNGARLFHDKSCNICHDKSMGETFVLELSEANPISSPVEMVQIMWNHGLKMEEMMHQLNIPWPMFREGEMADLYLYILSIQEE